MTEKKRSLVQQIHDSEERVEDIKDTLNKSKKDPTVKAALKIEKQPENIEDLSPLHNTREIGTSGGDQRASEDELKQATVETGEKKPNGDSIINPLKKGP